MTDHKTDITDSRNPMSLGTLPIGKLLMQYSVPAIIAAVTMSLYNIIDSIFIGRGVGAMAIAGLAITFPLMNLVIAFCTFIAVGGATISSIYLGQKEMSKATDVINNVLVLCLIHSLVFGGLTFIFLDDVLTLFGATPEMLPYAREFMRVILLGTPIAYVFIGLNNLMRATGYPRKAMVSALLSVGVNIVLCPIFIYKFKWGIGGAAFASVCGQFTAFCWVVLHFCSKKSFVHFDRHNRWFTPSIIKKIYSIGLSPFLMNTTACVVVVFLNMALLTYGGVDGNLAVGAYGIVNRTTMFFVMVVFGVTQGMQPILGFNYGANQDAGTGYSQTYRALLSRQTEEQLAETLSEQLNEAGIACQRIQVSIHIDEEDSISIREVRLQCADYPSAAALLRQSLGQDTRITEVEAW